MRHDAPFPNRFRGHKDEDLRHTLWSSRGLRDPAPIAPVEAADRKQLRVMAYFVAGTVGRITDEKWLAERTWQAVIATNDCVESDPAKLGGAPVIRGTRFALGQLFAELADGSNVREIARNFSLDRKTLRKLLHALGVALSKRPNTPPRLT